MDRANRTASRVGLVLRSALARTEGRTAWHSASGWSVVGAAGDLLTVWPDGTQTRIPAHENELPWVALRERLVTYGSVPIRVWLRDPATGSREEVTCPDGSPPSEILGVPSRYHRCAEAIFTFGDADFVPTGHRIDDARRETAIRHVEPGAYTVATTDGWPSLDAALSIYAPDGTLLARESRTYTESDIAPMTDAALHVRALRADPHRLVAAAQFTHFAIGPTTCRSRRSTASSCGTRRAGTNGIGCATTTKPATRPPRACGFPRAPSAPLGHARRTPPRVRLATGELADVSAGFVFEPK